MIGGYHAAKLTRYQDMIDRHLIKFQGGDVSEADMNVLNMLNARYLVMSDDEVYVNPDALGNAWFVDKVMYVDGADAEMAALDTINPAVTAVSDAKFRDILGANVPVKQPGDTIFETTYAPNRLTYHAQSGKGGVAVFSEVYFPWGWKAWIDGEPADIARVDYLLRAMRIPAGTHEIKMEFDPESLHVTSSLAYVSIIIIYIAVVAAALLGIIGLSRRKEDDES